MNILFLSLIDFNTIEEKDIYTDLLREFTNNNHCIYAVSPVERRQKRKTEVIVEKNANILKLKIGNIQKTNLIEKGISTVMIEHTVKRAINKYFPGIKFDLIIYATPPITFYTSIKYLKKRDDAKTYLLLKDIFPQNAVDIGILTKKGIKGIIYRFFRMKECKLYKISDHIGCMSKANKEYLLAHNKTLDSSTIDIAPNSIEVFDTSISLEKKNKIRKEYNIPQNKKIFIYGGNLGKPQGIDFLISCLKSQEENPDAYFIIVGDGTEYYKIDNYIREEQPQNVRLIKKLPKKEYDTLVGSCDVGMIFLDHKFTIPNVPSRILSYMQAKLPVLVASDISTDVGDMVEAGEFGYKCFSNDVRGFSCAVNKFLEEDCEKLGLNGWSYLNEHFSVAETAKTILDRVYSFND